MSRSSAKRRSQARCARKRHPTRGKHILRFQDRAHDHDGDRAHHERDGHHQPHAALGDGQGGKAP
ncbi:MAG: hypothetical protein ACJ762_06175 [Solirubrobacteraceae bacterium]